MSAPTVLVNGDLEVRAMPCPCGTGQCNECSDEGMTAIPALLYCAICDCDRMVDVTGEERGDEWFCGPCLETEPCPACEGAHHHKAPCEVQP